jgi:hypothetical protein
MAGEIRNGGVEKIRSTIKTENKLTRDIPKERFT